MPNRLQGSTPAWTSGTTSDGRRGMLIMKIFRDRIAALKAYVIKPKAQ